MKKQLEATSKGPENLVLKQHINPICPANPLLARDFEGVFAKRNSELLKSSNSRLKLALAVRMRCARR
jgi:hypothetical protein